MAERGRLAAALEYLSSNPVVQAMKGFGSAQGEQLQQMQDAFLSANPITRPFVAGGEHDVLGNTFNTGKQIGQALVNDPGALANALKGGFADAARNIQTPEGAGRAVGNLFSPMEVASGLQRLGKPLLSEMTVYHGTPHRFPATEANPLGEFDASKIGTGEGAQAYGHGLYLAESPDVAKTYIAPGLGQNMDTKIVRRISEEIKSTDPVEVFNAVEKYFSDAPKKPKIADSIKSPEDVKRLLDTGSLYHVDLPDPMIEKMLDWDKPLSEQPEYVRNILENRFPAAFDDPRQQTGGSLYKEQVKKMMHMGVGNATTPEAFMSDVLKQYGIPGIRYLDAGSRDVGNGTRNFVIFPGEEKNLKILERK